MLIILLTIDMLIFTLIYSIGIGIKLKKNKKLVKVIKYEHYNPLWYFMLKWFTKCTVVLESISIVCLIFMY